MYLIQQILNSPYQQQSFVLYNGNILTITLSYLDSQQGWFMDLVYGDFSLLGTRVTVSPNMLNQFRNQIDFGLGCFTTLLREPTLQQDFSSGNFNLYVLTQVEVDNYNQLLSNGPPNVTT